MQNGENSRSFLGGQQQRMDISQPTHVPGKSPCFDRRQPVERRQTSGMGSIEKLLAPELMQTHEKMNIMGMQTSKDMNVMGVSRPFDQPHTSSTMQHPDANPEIILVSEVHPGFEAKGAFGGNQQQPKELHAEILLDRPGPSGMQNFQEFQQRMDVNCPPMPMSSMDDHPTPSTSAQGESSQRDPRDVMREILSLLNGYTKGIPYPITKYYLESAGFNNFSPEIVQLMGLTAQKYIHDILSDALINSKARAARENAERGGNANTPLTLLYADLAPALKKHKDKRNLDFIKKKDSILESFRKLLIKRNVITEDGKPDVIIEKMEELLVRVDHYSHTESNEGSLASGEDSESDESDEQSRSESNDDSKVETSSTCSICSPDPTSISTSLVTTPTSTSAADDSDSSDDESSSSSSQASQMRIKLINKSARLEKRVEDLMSVFKKLSTSISSEEEEDECDKFATLLADKLRKLDIKHREDIMSEIDNLLLKNEK